MSSLIVAATPVAGHTFPLLQIGGQLQAAGHDVVFLGGRRFLPRAEELGMRGCPLRGRADYDDRDMASQFPDSAALPPGLQRLNLETTQVFGEPIPDQHAVLQELLAEDPERTLISDILFAGAFPAACGAGRRPRRWISVGIAPLYVRSTDTSPFGPAPRESGGDPADANLAAFEAFTGALAPAFERISSIIESLGARMTAPDWVSALYDLPDVTAQLSVPEFEFPRSDVPDSIHYVGIAPPDSGSWTAPPWWNTLDGDRPVVLITQGTLANHDLTELIVPGLQALDGQDVTVVAALGRPVNDLPITAPRNAQVVDYVPFDRLLPRVDVMITNGGFGATQQALAAGVPTIVAGASEDKPATAARVAFHRVGLDLGTGRPSPEQIRDAVTTVLADHDYRGRACALAEVYARYDSAQLIETLVTQP